MQLNKEHWWLEQSQAQGSFDGFDEENKHFRQCTDDEIEWYFVEWFFTDGFKGRFNRRRAQRKLLK
ncbi:hypothetical protein FOC52_13540 (plasmid) [Staphylococcus cohnii]|nr:hypothetical protein FOC52_13540 [Staphylococcus cohnii]